MRHPQLEILSVGKRHKESEEELEKLVVRSHLPSYDDAPKL